MPPRRFPKAAVASVIGLILLEAAFWSSTDPLTGIPVLQPTAEDATVVAKRQLMGTAKDAVLLIGDSSCMMGLIPEDVGREAGVPVLNLGTLASFTMVGFTSLAEEMMQSPTPPRMVVVAMLPQSMETSAHDARRFGLIGRYLLAYGGSMEIYKPTLDDWWHLAFFKHRFNVFPSEFGGTFNAFYHRLKRTHGWLPEQSRYSGASRRRDCFVPASYTSDALRLFVRKAEQQGIPVLFWWSPSPIDASISAYRKAAQEELQAIQASVPWLGVIQPGPPAWPVEDFGTVTHLTPEAAKRNSAILGGALKQFFCCEKSI